MFAIKDPFYEPPEIDFANQEILVEEREVIPRDFKSHANKAYVKFVARDYWNQRLNVLRTIDKEVAPGIEVFKPPIITVEDLEKNMAKFTYAKYDQRTKWYMINHTFRQTDQAIENFVKNTLNYGYCSINVEGQGQNAIRR